MPFGCVVNATPVGMHPNVNESPFEREHLRPYMVVFDTVYNPENTLLIKEARQAGCRIVSGVDMFVRQAAIQFRIWHGQPAPEKVMREALKRATASAKQPA
jgi:3-dehydroquinate dehydratase/shikimate dehydrogenase